MPQEYATWNTLFRGVERRTNERHTFIIPRCYVHTISLGSTFYCGTSSVPHARPATLPKDRQAPYHTLPGLLAEALRFAEAHADHKLLIAAHCEAGSATTHGIALSRLRVQAVHALLNGDRATFIEGCGYYLDDDVVRLLSWVDSAYGYGCTPKLESDGKTLGWITAIEVFRAAHVERFGGTFPDIQILADEDLGAVFDLMEMSVADQMETDVDGLNSARSKLSFLAPEQLACGNQWPDEDGVNRVDLLFFQPDPAPPRFQDDARPGISIYASEMYVLRWPIEVPLEPVPLCICMTGMYFDTNKCFLLPAAMQGLQGLVEHYAELPEGELIVVGHTDTSGEYESNLTLSLDRAKAVVAYLNDDVDSWLALYEKDIQTSQRWGTREDRAMLGALPDAAEHQAALNPIESYQRSRGLKADGKSGPNTRTQLISDYMALDGTTLPDGITPIAHGCGEHFPLVQTGDGVSEDQNRRVELFHFEQGIKPAPAGVTSAEGSAEYGKWRRAVVIEVPFETQGGPIGKVELSLRTCQGLPVRDLLYTLTRSAGEEYRGSVDEEGHLLHDGLPMDHYDISIHAGERSFNVEVPWLAADQPAHRLILLQLENFLTTLPVALAQQVRLKSLGHALEHTGDLDDPTNEALALAQTNLGRSNENLADDTLTASLRRTYGA